jgi:general secretion pathway protein B
VSQEAQQPVPVGAADISISGIAWQDERSLRRAVLNGSLVGEGATVSGARVVEIQETRVRMSRNGRLFDLTLGSSIPR